jgi:hypothetical protein
VIINFFKWRLFCDAPNKLSNRIKTHWWLYESISYNNFYSLYSMYIAPHVHMAKNSWTSNKL